MLIVKWLPGTTRRPQGGTVRGALRIVCAAAAAALAGMAAPAHADDWGFGAVFGAITATVKGTPAVFRITTTKVISPEFTWGPTFYLTPAGEA